MLPWFVRVRVNQALSNYKFVTLCVTRDHNCPRVTHVTLPSHFVSLFVRAQASATSPAWSLTPPPTTRASRPGTRSWRWRGPAWGWRTRGRWWQEWPAPGPSLASWWRTPSVRTGTRPGTSSSPAACPTWSVQVSVSLMFILAVNRWRLGTAVLARTFTGQ